MIIDAKSAFGILADGSDETTKINAAFAAAGGVEEGELLYFGPGIYGCDGLDQLTGTRNFFGAGMRKTTFKNLSPNVRLFDFEPGTGPAYWGSSFMRASGFSIDQNGCSGSAIRLNVQYNGLRDVWVRNQGGGIGGDYAINAVNATLCDLDNVHVSNSDNCLNLQTCYYVNGRNISLERQKGRALMATGCAQTQLDGLYVDHGNPSSVGCIVPEMVLVNECTSFHISGLSTEIADAGTMIGNVPVAGEAPARAYMLFKHSRNINIHGGRINHSAVELSSYMMFFEDCSASLDGFEWYETKNGMILAGVSASNKRLSVKHVDTYVTAPTSRYGIGNWYGKTGRIRLEDWTDYAKLCSHFIQAGDAYASQVTGPIQLLEAGPGRRTFFNCSGGVGGTVAGAHMVNC